MGEYDVVLSTNDTSLDINNRIQEYTGHSAFKESYVVENIKAIFTPAPPSWLMCFQTKLEATKLEKLTFLK